MKCKNQVIVGHVKDVLKDTFFVDNVHWLYDEREMTLECAVRIRHLGELYNCIVSAVGKGLQVNAVDKIFGLAKGQAAVFYTGDTVIAGGTIS